MCLDPDHFIFPGIHGSCPLNRKAKSVNYDRGQAAQLAVNIMRKSSYDFSSSASPYILSIKFTRFD
jgi:hypothetical protein